MLVESEKIVKAIAEYRDSEKIDDTVTKMVLTHVIKIVKKISHQPTKSCASCKKVLWDNHLGFLCQRTDVSENLVAPSSVCDQWE